MTQKTKARVMHGTIPKTVGGLTKKDIKTIHTKDGTIKYVSKKKSANAKNNFQEWNKAVAQAKKNLNIGKHEFILLKKNSKLYKEAKNIYDK